MGNLIVFFLGLGKNLAFLVCLTFLYSLVKPFLHKTNPLTQKIMSGVIFGLIAVMCMIDPIVYIKGVFFDGREIVIVLSALFGGAISALITGAIVETVRIFIGGTGLLPGTFVVISTVSLGSLLHYKYGRGKSHFRYGFLFAVGMATVFVTFPWLFVIPDFSLVLGLLKTIVIPMAIIYPVGMVFAGTLLSYENKKYEIERELEWKNKELKMIFDSVPAMIFYKDRENRFLRVNKTYVDEVGIPEDKLIGERDDKLFNRDDARHYEEDDLEVIETGQAKRNILETVETYRGTRWVRTDKIPYRDEDGNITGIVGFAVDVTKDKESEEKINYLAYYDPLTGLPNRMLLHDRLGVATANAHRSGNKVAVLFLDLDNFKTINDTMGHLFGDRFLKSVADILKSNLREGDTIARFGGDEFVILLPEITGPDDALKVAKKINNLGKEPLEIDNHEYYFTMCIGISIYPDDGRDIEMIVKNADAAMYRAKELGKDNFQMYAETLNESLIKRFECENGLRHALVNNEFLIYYQPEMDMKTGEMVGMEALIRWDHPEMGITGPSEFIEIAEETGVIVPIGEWMVKQVCSQIKEWQKRHLDPIKIFVNISMRQLQQKDIMEMLLKNLEEAGLDTGWIELEITESTAIKDFKYTRNILSEMSSRGIKTVLDDFGTGYSSINYLKDLPISSVKIDGAFVRDISDNPGERAIGGAIIDLAHRMDLTVVAEGVETEEQYELLKKMGCDRAQGYYTGRPLPPDEVENMLKNQNKFRA